MQENNFCINAFLSTKYNPMPAILKRYFDISAYLAPLLLMIFNAVPDQEVS
jgi:hypothetical protein